MGAAKRISNPGCYPTGTLLLLRPLLNARLLDRSAPIHIHALSGYSGGGRQLIERWEDPSQHLASLPFEAPYALERAHKHLTEMIRYSTLEYPPVFAPAVGSFARGMRIQIPLHPQSLPSDSTGQRLHEALTERYKYEAFIRVIPLSENYPTTERDFNPSACNETNRVELRVLPSETGSVVLMAILDNLGKGASGAAVQNLNLALGLPESRGLAVD